MRSWFNRLKYRVIPNECHGFNSLSYTIHLRWQYIYFFYLIEQHSQFLLHTLRVLYMCTLCDSTNINMIIEFVPHVSGDGFNGGSDSYLQFWDTHTPCLLKLCIPPSNGIVGWWLFEFGAELPLDNCTLTVILNNPVFPFLLLELGICSHALRGHFRLRTSVKMVLKCI